jgi:hypothetical protein
MTSHRRRATFISAAALAIVTPVLASSAYSSPSGGPRWTAVSANPKVPGVVAPDLLSPELAQVVVAQGAMKLENGTAAVPYYGYDGDKPTLVPLPSAPTTEAHKTEPDKNTYLTFRHGLPGADAQYDYGSHFLFQGHESGTPGYITRVNLDADAAHRVTLVATADVNGVNLPDFDGSTWDPFAGRLLFTAELGANGGVWQSDLAVPAHVQDISGVTGRAGYEGVQNDGRGNLYLVEDSGGVAGTSNPNAKQPNSFVFRLLPKTAGDLTQGGRLQALQVIDNGQPITFHAGQADSDIKSAGMLDLHTYGRVLSTRWVTIHDTATDGFAPFDANAKAKAASATPFKRPENGVFAPDGTFRTFVFTETGDTNVNSEAGAAYGGFGALMKLTQSPTSDNGSITILYRGDVTHMGLDNITFTGRRTLAAVEDASDPVHTARNAFDSGYLFSLDVDYAHGAQPVRFLAQGRDASATIDAACGSACGNDGDNEITGIHVSNGDPGKDGVLGSRAPQLFESGWRMFYTRQHGDNVTFEVISASSGDDHRGGHQD